MWSSWNLFGQSTASSREAGQHNVEGSGKDKGFDSAPDVNLGRDRWKTYRVRGIPTTYDKQAFQDALSKSLEIEPEATTVHSFSSSIDKTRTATVTFSDWTSGTQSKGQGVQITHPGSGKVDKVHLDTHFYGFTPISPIENDWNHSIDLVAIHGWGSHPLGGFKAHDDTYVWLRDSLALDIPEYRVFLYGYACDLADTDSVSGVDEYGRTLRRLLTGLRRQDQSGHLPPLVFIVHSLGGLVFQQAIISMNGSSSSDDHRNLRSVFGALLFGVPGQGMETAELAAMVGNSPQRYILELLNKDVGALLRNRKQQDFRDAFDNKDSKIIQFYETRKTATVLQNPHTKKWSRDGPKKLLVTPESASCGRPWEQTEEHMVDINANHSDLVKFTSQYDTNYDVVKLELRKFAQEAPGVVRRRFQEEDLGPGKKGG